MPRFQDLHAPIISNLSSQRDLSYAALEQFLTTAAAHKLFARTLSHESLGEIVSWAPTKWLLEISNPQPLSDTTTSGADGQPDRRINLELLYQNMLDHGMRDPFVIGIGLDTGKVRLEEGNQRVQCLAEHGIAFAPVVGHVGKTSITNKNNGTHEGRTIAFDSDQLYPLLGQRISIARTFVATAD